MDIIWWFVIVGVLLVSSAFVTPLVQRLPLSVSTLYLGVGFLLGPGIAGLLSWDVVREAGLFERLTEIAVIVSLFTVGLNMRRSPTDRSWLLPVRLATITMIVTIIAVAAVGVWLLALPLGAAVLLGAVLAPTDPVLATDVQMQDATDQDVLRHAISGEAGLNDGTAFPFVMLGLGLLALHPDAEAGLFGLWAGQPFTILGWLGWDLLWAVTVGLVVGGVVGYAAGKAALALHRHFPETFSLHQFLVLGLIALSYGLAELVYGYGFLAVFATGYALRYIELQAAGNAATPAELPPIPPGESYTVTVGQEPGKAAQFLAVSLLDFNDKLEHILAAGVVVLVGGVFSRDDIALDVLWFAPLLFLLIRPLAVEIGMIGSGVQPLQRRLMGWFGIRGIGSIYYLTYAIEHGLEENLAQRLTAIVLSIIVVSIVVHGVSVTPLMTRYESRRRQHETKPQSS
jgi:sodium/hydrogen antiporter